MNFYKQIGGLIAAVSGLASAGNVQASPIASPPQLTKAQSFAELLDPNAAALLRVADAAAVAAARQSGSSKNPNLKLVYDHHYVDLGHIDLLVQEGFYSNRTDFIRTAIRNRLAAHQESFDLREFSN
jgi:Ribbon-Helix-Helix transcriptional regulator family